MNHHTISLRPILPQTPLPRFRSTDIGYVIGHKHRETHNLEELVISVRVCSQHLTQLLQVASRMKM
jgi:hypothetical protein